MSGPKRALLGAVLIFLGVFLTGVWLGGAGHGALLGFDAFPLIAASHIDQPYALFADPLMGGRYPDGVFHRPLVHLSFAIDAVSGSELDGGSFRGTDTIIAGLSSAVLGGIVLRLVRRDRPGGLAGGIIGALAALMAYGLHRAQLDVIPYAPRRADALCVLFLGATVLATLRSARPWELALWALLAFWSKESGVLALPLIFLASLTQPLGTTRDALLRVLAPLAALVLALVVRFAVLGELGGHAESGLGAFGELGGFVGAAWSALARDLPGGPWVLGGVLIAAMAALGSADAQGRRVVVLALGWFTAALAITAFSGRMHAWYAVALLPGVAILLGTTAGRMVEDRRPIARVAGVAALALVALFAAASKSSPQREVLEAAATIAADQTERFRGLLRGLQPGQDVAFEPYVFAVAGPPGTPPVYVHAPYSLAALAELQRPSLDVRVLAPGEAPGSPGSPSEALVRLVPGAPPAGGGR